MKIKKTSIKDCYKLNFNKNKDNRGSFHRSFCKKIFRKKKINFDVKQCNISVNKFKFTLRGFHYLKKPHKENKIIIPIHGSTYNVIIDLRKKSKTYLKKFVTILSNNSEGLIIPTGCANAFLTLSKNTIIQYYMDNYYETIPKSSYLGIKFDDKFFNIKWPYKIKKISTKDKNYKPFNN